MKFAADAAAERTETVEVVIDGSDTINARVINLAIKGTTLFVVQEQVGKLSETLRIVAQVRLWFNPGREEALFIVPGSYGVIL